MGAAYFYTGPRQMPGFCRFRRVFRRPLAKHGPRETRFRARAFRTFHAVIIAPPPTGSETPLHEVGLIEATVRLNGLHADGVSDVAVGEQKVLVGHPIDPPGQLQESPTGAQR